VAEDRSWATTTYSDTRADSLERPFEEHEVRLQDDLRALTSGSVHLDDLTRSMYSNDASILEVIPQAVVAPRQPDELAAIIKYAAEQNISVHPRGSGTGLAGESLGPGIVLDLTRHLNRILHVGSSDVLVEPGVRLADVQRALAPQGRMIAVDPVSGDRCTVGGMVGTNAAGPHSIRYGTTRDHVLSVKGILATGETLTFDRWAGDTRDPQEVGTLAQIARQLMRVLAANARSISEEQPPELLKHGGYELRGLYDGRSVDLARLFAGAEGTLAVATEIKLATVPTPPFRGMLLATFASLAAAVDAVAETIEYQPTACELLDRRLLSVVREVEPWYREWVSDAAEAILIIEHEGNSADNVVERVLLNQNRLDRIKKLTLQTREVYGEPYLSLCWKVRDRAMPRMTRPADNVLPTPFVENTAVPPSRFPEFLARVQNIMKKFGVTATYSAHAAVGILHSRPLLDLHRIHDREKMVDLAEAMFEAVMACGGTFNGEHGAGLLRSAWLPRQYPGLYPAFLRIKSIFDPGGVLNPGRVTGADQSFPTKLLRPATLRPTPASEISASPTERAEFLRWPKLSVIETAQRCNGCGSCQSLQPSMRMCPTYRADTTEAGSPRALANVVRQTLQGEIAGLSISSPELRELADHCVYCKMCRLECPTGTDISKLMLEAKAAHVAEHGLGRTDWFMAHWPGWARWGSSQAHFANRLFAGDWSRWMLENLVGLSRKRRLYRFDHRTFLERARREGWTRKPRSKRNPKRVALFVDTYTNHHDPELGESVARLLIHFGYQVFVPARQRASGMTLLQQGDIETARSLVLWNFEIAVELAREGFFLVMTEPSAALMLRDEARHLIADTDIEFVAQATFEASEFFARAIAQGDIPTGQTPVPISVGYHEPCHQRALEQRAWPVEMLHAIPGLRVVEMDLGCSGMAGTFGMRADGFDASLRAGRAMLERLSQGDILAGTTQCGSCRMQMEQGSRKPTVHPVKLLALSHGLVPQPQWMFRPIERGILS
jgi:FAD/FMN-containing dehydrogenase/Fe-S oxidoreductase